MTKCLNCGYERQSKDGGIIPYTGCPRCHIIYDEIKDESRTSDRFSLKGGVIYDSLLGLEWAPCNGQSMNHRKAEKYARNLNLAGGGWRLPTREELKSLYDTDMPFDADPVFYIVKKSTWTGVGSAWTSELTFLWGMGAWFFNFTRGCEDRGFRVPSNGCIRVLAVRTRR